MKIDAHAAEIALGDVNRVKVRAGAFHAYARTWPSFLVWGLVWMAANIVQQFAPSFAALAWFVGIGVGIASSITVGLADHREEMVSIRNARLMRFAACALIIAAALAGVFNIVGVRDAAAINAVLSLLVAAAYSIAGLWSGARFLLLGIVLGIAILGGWIWLREFFALWVGLFGGGAIVLASLWLRTA